LALDRESTLKKAEKLLRQGRLDAAIAEYQRVVEDNPRDWSTANTLGELYARSGQSDKAVEEYARIAEHFVHEGFYPKAAALYKKILKIRPQDEPTQLELADISAKQGLLADAKAYLNAVAARRRTRGDRRGAAEIVVKLGSIDPADFEARRAAARMLEEMGEEEQAGLRFKALHDDLLEKGRQAEALESLQEYVRLNPLETGARATLAKAALDRGDVSGAREYLDPDSAGDDPDLLIHLAEVELRAGAIDRAKPLLTRLPGGDAARRQKIATLGRSFVDQDVDASFLCLDWTVDAAVAVSDFTEASATLQEFTSRVPGHIPALLKLVEVCVDGGLELAMYEAQERLTDAYLEAGHAAEARVIAEDLVAREPWERAHIERFRRALVMLRVSDPDSHIAERLSGQAPFMARDPFFEMPETPPEPPEPEPAAGEALAEAAPGADGTPGETPAPVAVDAQAVGDQAAVPPAAAPAPAARRAGQEEIDLTGALGELETGDAQRPTAPQKDKDLDQVFADLRNEASADRDHSAQHMTLARTYLEIGMIEEAMTSLQTAARSPRQRFEAASTLGRLYQRRGEASAAIEWLERAAEAPAPTADEGRALLYDLGVLLDGAGETSRALAVFLELQADVGDYRDVPTRIDRLARVQTGG
jgi:tetratricopeptide (TPR) repeat protein